MILGPSLAVAVLCNVLNIVSDGVGLLGGTINYLVSHDDHPRVAVLYNENVSAMGQQFLPGFNPKTEYVVQK